MKWIILLTVLLCCISNAFSVDYYKQVDFLLSGYRNPVTDEPLEGGKVYIYQSGGMLTPETLYQDREGLTPHTNPIVLDIYGKAEAYGNGVFRFVIKTSEDVSIETIDGYECYSATADATTSIVDSIEDIETTIAGLSGIYLKKDASNDPLTGSLDVGNTKITSVATPTTGTDAVNKTYADGYLAGLAITTEALADGDLLQYETTGTYFKKIQYDELIGASGEVPLIIFDIGNTAHGGTASVSHAGYTTRFFMTGFTIEGMGGSASVVITELALYTRINETTGAVTCRAIQELNDSGSPTAKTGTLYWMAISVRQ